MAKRKWPAAILVASLILSLSVGLFYFAGLTTPSSYPDMSSLNSGPQGAKLLFDALAGIRPLTVSRNYLPFSRWRPSSTAILLFAVTPLSINFAGKDDLIELEKLSQPNNRVILCIQPAPHLISGKFTPRIDTKQQAMAKTRWGIRIVDTASKDAKVSILAFDHDASWEPLPGAPETLEKQFGKQGSIVITLHGRDFSNEHLAANNAALANIPSLLGPYQSIAFDEEHFGIEESGSIAALARRFRLQGLIAGLILLAALFIWNQSVSFPPPSQFETNRDRQIVTAEAREVFAGLILRHLTPQALIDGCVAEWNRVKPRQRINVDLPSSSDSVAAYRKLQESLQKKPGRI